MGFQIILSLLVLVALIRLFVQYIKKNINHFFFIFFAIVWFSVLFFTWNIDILDKFGSLLGLERGADILVYIALFLLFYYVFVSIVKTYMLEDKISKLVRKDAINDFLKRYNIDK